MRLCSSSLCFGALVTALVASSRVATADTAAPAPYSLPWQLRPVVAQTVLRSDTSYAMYEDALSRGGATAVTTLTGCYKIPSTGGPGEGLVPMVRVALANDSPPVGPGGLVLTNPVAGATYARKLGDDFRLALFLGFSVPIGMGGGDHPDAGLVDTRAKGIYARSAMDNAFFTVNDLAIIPSVGFAYVAHGLTAQVDAGILQLMRVRGSGAQLEASKTNFVSGLHLGYFLADMLSLGVELRYQRWLNAPFAIDKDTTDTLRDNLTVAGGPRMHFEIGDGIWIRPGISYARGLDKPMAAAAPNYHIVQLDVPVAF